MYGILTDDDEETSPVFEKMRGQGTPTPANELPVVADAPGLALADDAARGSGSDAAPAGDRTTRESGPASLTSAEKARVGLPTASMEGGSWKPERLVGDDGEGFSLLLPLLRVMARADIEAKAGELMARVLREKSERQRARQSSTR